MRILFVLLLPVMVISCTVSFYKVQHVFSSEITQDSNGLCQEVSLEKDFDDDVACVCEKKDLQYCLLQLCTREECELSGVLSNALRSLDTPPPKA